MNNLLKTAASLFFILTCLLITPSVYADPTESVRVWSFNMEGWRHQLPDHLMEKRYESFLEQKEVINEIPDLIATQEDFGWTLSDFVPALQAKKPGTTFEEYGRSRNAGVTPAETNAIVYNQSRFKLVPEIAAIQNTLHTLPSLILPAQGKDPAYPLCDSYVTHDNLTCQLLKGAGRDTYARIMTWGIFQEISNPGVIVIFTSTHQSLDAIDQPMEQQRFALIVNELIKQVQYYHKGITPIVIMAGDYNTPNNFKMLNDTLDSVLKNGKIISWQDPSLLFTVSPDSILSNAPSTGRVNYFNPAIDVTDHGPIAETVMFDPGMLQPKE